MQTTPTAADFEERLLELKEVKLKLPLKHHVHLHSLKLLRNQSISELVANALDAYFNKSGAPALGSVAGAVASVPPGPETGGPDASSSSH